MDQLYLRDVRLEAKVGIYKRERGTTQPIALDLDIALPGARVFASGRVADTIDYAVLVGRIRAELAERRFGLVEELAAFVAELVLDEFGAPYVVKADGLAAGKGVLVTEDRAAALEHVATWAPHGEVLVEEFLDGQEVSLFFFADGHDVVPLSPAQDF